MARRRVAKKEVRLLSVADWVEESGGWPTILDNARGAWTAASPDSGLRCTRSNRGCEYFQDNGDGFCKCLGGFDPSDGFCMMD